MQSNQSANQAIPLNHAAAVPAKSSWPVTLFIPAFVWACLGLYGYVAMTISHKDDQIAQWRIQAMALLVIALRFGVARCRRERGRTWIVYWIGLVLAPMLWIAGVSIFNLVRS